MTLVDRPIRFAAVALFALLAACADSAPETADTAATAADTTTGDAAAAGDVAAASDALLDPNAATREQLLEIPGMDEATADAILDGQPYENMLQVDTVLAATLDEDEREAVYAHLWHPIDLNTASSAEIQLIPGVGDRMTHEFEEYRPYRAIEQFRREIGKYVDEEEVARLEQYVTIR